MSVACIRFSACSLGNSCGGPLTDTTVLSVQGTVSGVWDAIISSPPKGPPADDVCIKNDAQPRQHAPGSGEGSAPFDSHSNETVMAHVAASARRGRRQGGKGYYSGRVHVVPDTDIDGYRIQRVLLFRGHVTAMSPDLLCTLEDGYFEFSLYAVDFDYGFPPGLTPVSKAEAAAERVFDPFTVTMTLKTQQGPRY